MRRENFYSKLVAWLKILLPLMALAILSSVVFFARDSEDYRTIPFVTHEGGPDTPDERLTRPEYVGLTGDGSTITLQADRIVPVGGNPELLDASSIDGRIETEDGRTVTASSPKGRFDFTKNIAVFEGEVTFETSDGYDLSTPNLSARLDATLAESPGPVAGTGPIGTLDAGSMRLSSPQPGQSLLVFKGGVKLVYEPRNPKGAE